MGQVSETLRLELLSDLKDGHKASASAPELEGRGRRIDYDMIWPEFLPEGQANCCLGWSQRAGRGYFKAWAHAASGMEKTSLCPVPSPDQVACLTLAQID